MDPSSTLELGDKPLRERTVDSYRKFIDRGITSPDDLDLDDPEVKEANKLFDKWQKEVDLQAGENEEKKLRANIDKTVFYVDAGFTDPDYLDEVLNDWLVQDSQFAEKDEGNLERNITRQKIANAMKKIRGILKSKEVQS